ncbi:hypothetical protein [Polyangium aurulentum]|uniref:hypothetical protein n=1 Tax=Polyangium aurulentum TaxID=2567896 RepID=UPI0010AEB7B5|nr:hypothetical protein [Polyangium aurulentum]UQA59043.1 hypothetical protein E8A73_000540 [Polyangium aurulentum]
MIDRDRDRAGRRHASAIGMAMLFALVAACGGGGGESEGPKAAAAEAKAPACSTEPCADLGKCPLTEKEHLESFACRACSAESTKACTNAKECGVSDAAALEALICRALEEKLSCANAVEAARAGWKKEGEPPFLDGDTLAYAVERRYLYHGPETARCAGSGGK